MIVTPRFVFLHLHKSGGTFVNEILMRLFPQAQPLGYHAPRDDIPEQYRHLPVVGTIRNPWSYYVSWYFFQKQRQQPNVLFRTVSEDGELNFNETITNLVTLGERPALYRRLTDALPDKLPGRGINLNKAAVAALGGSGTGFYTFLAERLYGDLDDVRMMKMETLRDDLLDVLREFDVPADDATMALIRNREKRNTSRHEHFSTYYDEATRQRIAERDRGLIERFDYGFRD